MSKRALIWPPPYIITKMKHVRHVTIKLTLIKGLEFVVPIRFIKKVIPKLLKDNRTWIQKQFKLISRELYEIKSAPLPKQIHLAAVRQSWKVRYRSSSSESALLENTMQKTLLVTGNIKDKQTCKKRLYEWVKLQAKKRLTHKLKRVSDKIGLKFKDVVIRNQSGRWASCSARKRISLNYKLIFLPESLCKHILIHELCHTVHFDHSNRFWRLVAKHDKHWDKHYEAMQLVEHSIPIWTIELT
jgi:predicted metal-dependent hydrolase